jgi:FtsP/CotA-like multicopper oxidase with cupredoxin domain
VLVRRIVLALCTLFLVAVIAGSVADRDARRTRAAAPPATANTGPPAPVVRGTLPADGTVSAEVGDAVTVAVRTANPDEAWVAAMGLRTPTSSDVPGRLEFVAQIPGRHPVVLAVTGRRAGTIVIEAAGS